MNKSFFENLNFYPFFEVYFNNTKDLYVFAKDTSFNFTMINKVLLKRLGFISESEVIGKNDYDFFQPNLVVLFREEDSEVFTSKMPVLNRTWSVPNGKGGLDWYLSSKYPLFDQNGEVKGLVGIMQGITQAASILEPYSRMTDVLTYIQNRFSEQITMETLASMVNLSISQFERRFKKMMNMSPLKFVNKVRVDNACEMLLRTNLTLSAIALDCGFYDHSYFTKQFKAQMEMTPIQYRENYLN
jgi:AraC-like DNA-binding protein